MLSQSSNLICRLLSPACCAVWLVISSGSLPECSGEELFAAPAEVTTPSQDRPLPVAEPVMDKSPHPPSYEFRPLPPVGDIAGHRSSLLPRWTYSPLQSPLFFNFPAVTRPVIGPPLVGQGPLCQPSPIFTPPPAAPGYLRGPTRYGITSPVAPAVVSAHAPPWEQLPGPAELNGGILKVGKQCHDPRSCEASFSSHDFSPDPHYGQFGWDSCGELAIYGGEAHEPYSTTSD